MKSIVVILSLAIAGFALSSVLTPVSATRMDGKCCMSSDGNRSHRYQVVMNRRALPRTCSAYAASCIRVTSERADSIPMCMRARAVCLQTGVHVGPYSGIQFADLARR